MPRGIRGWLALLWFNLGFACPLVAANIFIKFAEVKASPAARGKVTLLMVSIAFMFVLGIIASFTMLLHKPIAVQLIYASLAGWLGYALLVFAVAPNVETKLGVARTALGVIGWGWYMVVSKRVKNTFSPTVALAPTPQIEGSSHS